MFYFLFTKTRRVNMKKRLRRTRQESQRSTSTATDLDGRAEVGSTPRVPLILRAHLVRCAGEKGGHSKKHRVLSPPSPPMERHLTKHVGVALFF